MRSIKRTREREVQMDKKNTSIYFSLIIYFSEPVIAKLCSPMADIIMNANFIQSNFNKLQD
jgi:hypothetical protein